MTAPTPPAGQRCGLVAVIGAPNAGKSTLINQLVGGKVSIVSATVQTTRTTVRGIVSEGSTQIVFVDTPGLFDPQRKLERAMVAAAWNSREDADIILLICDASGKKAIRQTQGIIERLKKEGINKPCCLVLNKLDLIKAQDLLKLSMEMNALYNFDATFMISAEKANGTKDILKYLAKALPESEWIYPEDQMSDMPQRLLAAEITREKLFHRLYQELPHALTVETDSWEEREDGSIMINQTIIVERDTQKGIVLGKGGSMIGAVGEDSRKELEVITEQRVHLKLFVKVRGNWSEDPEHYQTWGLDF